MENKKKKKSYYKSRRKEYIFDKEVDLWYFISINDNDHAKFCYVAEKTVLYGKLPVVVGIETYKLHKPGATIMRYEDVVKLKTALANATDPLGKTILQVEKSYEQQYVDADIKFSQSLNALVKKHNGKIQEILTSSKLTRI